MAASLQKGSAVRSITRVSSVEEELLHEDEIDDSEFDFLSPDLFSGATLHLRILSGDASGDLGRSRCSIGFESSKLGGISFVSRTGCTLTRL